MVSLIDFVLTHLPAPPARVLEVGCGNGELALALDAAGYEVMAIDPAAPDGAIFRRIKLEELEDDARFDAVVASGVFHHMAKTSSRTSTVSRARSRAAGRSCSTSSGLTASTR